MALEDLTKKPFFVDKNRAFWVLQSVGWSGYFILRSLGGIANNMGPLFILPTAIATATGRPAATAAGAATAAATAIATSG